MAEVDGELAGVIAWFPVSEGDAAGAPLRVADRAARAAVALARPAAPPARRRDASRRNPPARTLYVDALAVDPSLPAPRRRPALLERAERARSSAGLDGVALDTGLHNEPPARCTRPRASASARSAARRATHVAGAVGGPGFVGYLKAEPSRRRSASATRATWPSVICGKNGSATERAATSSHDRELALAVAEGSR